MNRTKHGISNFLGIVNASENSELALCSYRRLESLQLAEAALPPPSRPLGRRLFGLNGRLLLCPKQIATFMFNHPIKTQKQSVLLIKSPESHEGKKQLKEKR
jgi:hypothetical protein